MCLFLIRNRMFCSSNGLTMVFGAPRGDLRIWEKPGRVRSSRSFRGNRIRDQNKPPARGLQFIEIWIGQLSLERKRVPSLFLHGWNHWRGWKPYRWSRRNWLVLQRSTSSIKRWPWATNQLWFWFSRKRSTSTLFWIIFRKIIPENFNAPILLKLWEVPFKPEEVRAALGELI